MDAVDVLPSRPNYLRGVPGFNSHYALLRPPPAPRTQPIAAQHNRAEHGGRKKKRVLKKDCTDLGIQDIYDNLRTKTQRTRTENHCYLHKATLNRLKNAKIGKNRMK